MNNKFSNAGTEISFDVSNNLKNKSYKFPLLSTVGISIDCRACLAHINFSLLKQKS